LVLSSRFCSRIRKIQHFYLVTWTLILEMDEGMFMQNRR
jgi:hypothetical protein